jgi:hypothetical protein
LSRQKTSFFSVAVVDLKGTAVCSQRIAGPANYTVSTAGMDKGVCLIKILGGNESLVRRVLVK